MDFIGRNIQMRTLEESWQEEHPLVIVSGRTHMGKTRLLKEFCRGRDHLYLQAFPCNLHTLETDLREAVSKVTGEPYGEHCGDWRVPIRDYLEHGTGRKLIVIDEFPFAARSDVSFLPMFRDLWDTCLSKSDVMLVVSGSNTVVMNSIFRDPGGVMSDAVTADIALRPLGFAEVPRICGFRRIVEEYAFTGGIPFIMKFIDPDEQLDDNIGRLCFSGNGPLVFAQYGVLGQEFRTDALFMPLIKAVADGNRSMPEITDAMGVRSSAITAYISKLEEMGILAHEKPVTEPEFSGSRNTRYFLTDAHTEFWFRFVYRYADGIILNEPDDAMEVYSRDFAGSHVNNVFKRICREILREHLRAGGISARYGSYWRSDTEIDVVAVDETTHTVYAGECKYWKNPVGENVLGDLLEKCSPVEEFGRYKVVPCLFSASGYTERARAAASEAGALLFDGWNIAGE